MMNIRFYDLAEREIEARARLENEWQRLDNRKSKGAGNNNGSGNTSGNGTLGTADQLEYARLTSLKAIADGTVGKPPQFIDPLFASVRTLLASNNFGLNPIDVEYVFTGKVPEAVLKFPSLAKPDQSNEVVRVALTLGLLQLWGAPVPRLVADKSDNAVPDKTHQNYSSFGEVMVRAMARASANLPLAAHTLKTLVDAVNVPGDRRSPDISTVDFAKTFEKLLDRDVQVSDPSIKLQIEDAFERVQRIGADTPLHEFVLNLPDLEAATDIEVIPEHCRLMGSFIFASAFEELKAFQVVDKLVELSQRGEIPLMRGPAGTQLYNYWREAPNRMSEVERQNFYAMTLGLPTGQPGVGVNADFQDLWLRFVSSISTLVRESRVENLLRSNIPLAVNQQQVKKAARDLAHNMSSRGYGMAFYAAADLNKQINEIIQLLSNKELQRVFGATSPYDVIEQVAQTELGGARNSSKYRMLATSGAIITNWIADHADRLRDPTLPMIDLQNVAYPPARASGATAVSNPTDYDLVNACEMWLADSAMGEDRVAILSEPRESPQHSSRPIQIPSIARDLLEGTGLGLGMGYGGGYGGGYGNGNGAAPARANGRSYGVY
ncbi:hypothetical protein [Porphyrobacter sp. ULC335]|uniref:hypothetical protein n=1 Tax=Porphyrobacter sp. ULC335 TaxID=2854260 RepID=UPI00221EB199|nr:hypothetical protein [Porphyrobacter sp. ULC335]UYV14416.1 hypothetical protein KVF90_09535 [Porphyrobacter sp. ULC335]